LVKPERERKREKEKKKGRPGWPKEGKK